MKTLQQYVTYKFTYCIMQRYETKYIPLGTVKYLRLKTLNLSTNQIES